MHTHGGLSIVCWHPISFSEYQIRCRCERYGSSGCGDLSDKNPRIRVRLEPVYRGLPGRWHRPTVERHRTVFPQLVLQLTDHLAVVRKDHDLFPPTVQIAFDQIGHGFGLGNAREAAQLRADPDNAGQPFDAVLCKGVRYSIHDRSLLYLAEAFRKAAIVEQDCLEADGRQVCQHVGFETP